jgi:hypothetical protein
MDCMVDVPLVGHVRRACVGVSLGIGSIQRWAGVGCGVSTAGEGVETGSHHPAPSGLPVLGRYTTGDSAKGIDKEEFL